MPFFDKLRRKNSDKTAKVTTEEVKDSKVKTDKKNKAFSASAADLSTKSISVTTTTKAIPLKPCSRTPTPPGSPKSSSPKRVNFTKPEPLDLLGGEQQAIDLSLEIPFPRSDSSDTVASSTGSSRSRDSLRAPSTRATSISSAATSPIRHKDVARGFEKMIAQLPPPKPRNTSPIKLTLCHGADGSRPTFAVANPSSRRRTSRSPPSLLKEATHARANEIVVG